MAGVRACQLAASSGLPLAYEQATCSTSASVRVLPAHAIRPWSVNSRGRRLEAQGMAKEKVGGGNLRNVRYGDRGSEEKSREQRAWERMMTDVQRRGVGALEDEWGKGQLKRPAIVGVLVRLRQLEQWQTLAEGHAEAAPHGTPTAICVCLKSKVCEWLRAQAWWEFELRDYCLLMTAYARLGNSSKAESTVKALTTAGLTPDVIVNTALVEVYGREERFEAAEALLHRMCTEGPAPSVVTYQTLMQAYSKVGRLDDVERIIAFLERHVREPKADTDGQRSDVGEETSTADSNEDGAILKQEGEGGAVGAGPSKDVLRGDVQLDAQIYNTLIKAYAKERRFDDAERAVKRMRARGIVPTLHTYNIMIDMYGKEGRVKETEAVFRQLQTAGIRPDVVTYTSLIHAYGSAGMYDYAQFVFEDLVACRIRPNLKAYTALVNAYGRAGMVDEAWTVFKEMIRNRYEPDLEAYNTMISAYTKDGQMKKAEMLSKSMEREGINANGTTYACLIEGYGRVQNLKKAQECFESMADANVRPDALTYCALMKSYAAAEDFDGAVGVFDDMVRVGVQPNGSVKNILLGACTTDEEREDVLQLLEGVRGGRERMPDALGLGV